MSAILRRLGQVAVLFWLPVLLLLLVWTLSADSTSLYFPSASKVFDTLVDGFADGELTAALTFSLKNYVLGYAVAAMLGIGLGLGLGDHRAIREMLTPALNFMRALPNVALVPIFILALGIGSGPKIVLIAIGCFWPILLNTIDGIRSVNPAILETARSYRVPHRLRMSRVIFMGALPQIFAGLRIALAVGVVMMIVSEMYGSSDGVGYYILFSGQRFAVDETWAGTVLIGIVGYLVTVIFLAVEHAALAWHFQRPRKEKRTVMSSRSERVVVTEPDRVSPRCKVALRVEALTKEFSTGGTARHRVLENLSQTIHPGEFVCIVGPSGAGKTTLLRCLAGLMPPTSGTVRYGDQPVDRPLAEIAVVFQDYRGSLMPWMDVLDNVAFPLQGMGVRKAERNARAHQALESVGLGDVGGKYPWQLSGGMQQRVAIARALAYDSPILLMDEPFGSVDAQTRFELEDLILRLRATLGLTIVLVTHDIDEAVYLGDRVVVVAGKPTTVVDDIRIDLGRGRNQITTKADPRFTALRSKVMREILTPADEVDTRATADLGESR